MPQDERTFFELVRNMITDAIRNHHHKGIESPRINDFDIFGNIPSRVPANPATIATTGNTDVYILAPIAGHVISVDFSGVDALAASDTNYITFSITNLGQDGSGTTAVLGAVNSNTTKATGGTALSANTKRGLTLSIAIYATRVQEGDRLRIRAAVTGTLANTVTFGTYMLRFNS